LLPPFWGSSPLDLRPILRACELGGRIGPQIQGGGGFSFGGPQTQIGNFKLEVGFRNWPL
jgi:hypothetical protein